MTKDLVRVCKTAILFSFFACYGCSEDSAQSVPNEMPDTGVAPCLDCPAECPPEADWPVGFVCIPAGEFWMGSPETQIPRNEQNEQRHRVRISNAYFIGIGEVTQDEWSEVVSSNPAYFSDSGNGCELEPCNIRPVERLSWNERLHAMPVQRWKPHPLLCVGRLRGHPWKRLHQTQVPAAQTSYVAMFS